MLEMASEYKSKNVALRERNKMGPKKLGRPPTQKTEEQLALTATRAARSDDKNDKFHQLCELAKDTSA